MQVDWEFEFTVKFRGKLSSRFSSDGVLKSLLRIPSHIADLVTYEVIIKFWGFDGRRRSYLLGRQLTTLPQGYLQYRASLDIEEIFVLEDRRELIVEVLMES